MNGKKWDLIIGSKTKFLNFNFKELYLYRDLIYMFVKRDFVIFYKQTILGPLWYVIQPIITSIVFTIIFGKLANIPTDESPPFLFYMCGVVAWGYFATCLSLTSNTFAKNNEIFGKVYFPRLVVPIANVIIALFQFFIQFIIFTFSAYYFLRIWRHNIGKVEVKIVPAVRIIIFVFTYNFSRIKLKYPTYDPWQPHLFDIKPDSFFIFFSCFSSLRVSRLSAARRSGVNRSSASQTTISTSSPTNLSRTLV